MPAAAVDAPGRHRVWRTRRRIPRATQNPIAVAGLVLVLVRQRPGTANGILFMTIEDETGVANLVVRPDVYEQFRIAIRHSVSLVAWGIVERHGQVVHVLVRSAKNLLEVTRKVESLPSTARDFR